MYSRGSNLGKNIWDDGRIHIPPGYKGSAFRASPPHEPSSRSEGKIHPPEQKLYTMEDQQYTDPSRTADSDLSKEGSEFPAEDQPECTESEAIQEDNTQKTGKITVKPIQNYSPQMNELLTGLLHSLGREEWLLIIVIILLLADGSDAWDIILLMILLLGVH
ncbi:MAG: hypothetical protein IJ325_12445 [Clostridia bacterium]|nr:hypothetical protein [Clostridia bacterium]